MKSPGLLLFLLLTLTGCLPSSCQRQESQALFASDSLSRRLAEAVPADSSLRLGWRTTGTAEHPLAYPRTVRFGPDGLLYVGDVERASIFVFDGDGAFVREVTADVFDVPYLAGFLADTLVVFDPSGLRLDLVAGDVVVRSIAVEAEPQRGALVYAAAAGGAFYFKQVGHDVEGYLARLGADGRVDARQALAGPYWRYAGQLRPWGDSLLSLSGYRPVVDVVSGEPTGTLVLDTLALTGFDSPMLARSRSFALGEVGQAPLLSSSAAPAGELLFVLNLRPGWLQLDAFDHAGRLQRRLAQTAPDYQKDFFPQDLAVRRRDDGTYEAAVVFKTPEPRLDLYRF